VPPMNNRLMRMQRRRPDAPRILTANQTSGLTWTKPAINGAKITKYRVYESGVRIGETLSDDPQWPNDPTAGLSYEVSAVNAAGEGPKSKPVKAT
jgi:hypothetical protein